MASWGFWTYESPVPYDYCDPDLFNGYITQSYLRVFDPTGRTAFFYKISCDPTGFRGTAGELTSVEINDYWQILNPVLDDGQWHDSNGLIYIFNGAGQPKEIRDPAGNRQLLTYSGGHLESVFDEASDLTLTVYYNSDGLLDHISGPVTAAVPDGVWASYTYDAVQNLTSVTYPDGSGRIYEYNDPYDPNNMTAEKDQDGNFIFGWSYDDQRETKGTFYIDIFGFQKCDLRPENAPIKRLIWSDPD